MPSPTPSRAAVGIARAGLAARTGFYILLVYLIVRVAIDSRQSRPANSHGAMSIIAAGSLGIALLVTAAAGFAGFGGVRIATAIRHHDGTAWERARTAAEGVFYLGLAWVPLSFALGNHSAGSGRQQHQTTADLLHLPAGRVVVFALGMVVVGVAAYQIWTGVDERYVDRLDIAQAPHWVQRVVLASGKVGIPARALAFLPVGVFFMIAAVAGDASRADGLDHELTLLTGNPIGDVVLGLCALGLLVFVVYSALEVRYRDVAAT